MTDLTNPRNEEVYRKVVGLMQASSVRPLRIVPSGQHVRIYHEDELLGLFTKELFLTLTVYEILRDMGVQPNA